MLKRLKASSSKRTGGSTEGLLDHVPLLNILSPQDRQRILSELSETHYGKDDFIFREGDPTVALPVGDSHGEEAIKPAGRLS